MASVGDSTSVEHATATLSCILHTDLSTHDVVKAFDGKTWEKVQLAKAAHSSKSDSKYAQVCTDLPEQFTNKDGYHSKCYKNFTAYSKNRTFQQTTESTSEHQTSVLRSNVQSAVATTSGILEAVCIFCLAVRKRKKGVKEFLGRCETNEAENTIKDAASLLNDQAFLAKYGDINFVAKEAMYHHSCRKGYINQAERVKSTNDNEKSEYSQVRQAHSDAFELLKEYIVAFVVNKKRSEYVISIHDHYKVILLEKGIDYSPYSTQSLIGKVLETFNQLVVSKTSKKEGNVLHHNSISADNARDSALGFASSKDYETTKTATKLRLEILKLLKSSLPLPTPLTAEALKKGQVDAPDSLVHFFRVLCTGSERVGDHDSRSERYARSAADDAIFATTNGYIKPAKQICLGMGAKSLTGSRKVVEVLNRFSQCINYHAVEEYETELAVTISERETSTPDGLLRKPGLVTGCAWDNYDENMETLSGAGTLHDTFGICYQNVPKEVPVADTSDESSTVVHTPCSTLPAHTNTTTGSGNTSKYTKKKRSLELKENELQPYRKKPKISTFEFAIKTCDEPNNLQQVTRRDYLWMMCSHLYVSIPMWIGFNSTITEDTMLQQRVGYMKNICKPITRLDVIAETLKQTMQVAEECGQEYGIVTYDLAAAKPAIQMQAEESPLYDNVFICFGAFHITLAYFAGIGFVLAESGGAEILVETGVLASGSLNGFLAGKHYNRCKRLHPLLANAMRTLHFKSFLAVNGPLPSAFLSKLKELQENPNPEAMLKFEQSVTYAEVMDQYEQFSEDTRNHQHGATATYWLLYIDLVEIYLLFSRAVRTNDLDLFIYALFRMCDIFMATGHNNYTRYMILYVLKLLNIDLTHPGARSLLVNGALSIKRTNKPFTRCAVDLTLESTINADAASRSTGITAFTQSEEARHRWMVTQSARSVITGELFDMAGLKKNEDSSQELSKHRIKRDNEDLDKVRNHIEETLNPFDGRSQDTNLYCLTTGKAASDDVKKGLLGCRETGKEWCDTFRSECFTNPERFEKPIQRRKIKNFASDAVKTKLTVKDQKIKELQGTRDLFGRLLYLAVTNDLDLKVVFGFPLTPVPLALAHVDGTKHSTQKSKLMQVLEKRIHTVNPPTVDACAHDAMFIIQSQVKIPSTYGGLAEALLERILTAKRVDFVCDTYNDNPSIKDIERASRGANTSDLDYCITGSEQKTPKHLRELLVLSKFKRSLLDFLMEEWQKSRYVHLIQGHALYVGLGNMAWLYVVECGIVTRQEVQNLKCSHEEADTRLVWHTNHICNTQPGSNVVIRCNDTDILVILLPHVLSFTGHVWMDVGHNYNNTRRYIDVNALAEHLGPVMCEAMPGFHIFTGSDYTSAFFRKGKVRPLTTMEKKFSTVFSKLGVLENVDTEMIKEIESFVCCIYGKSNLSSVNVARNALFHQYFSPKKNALPLEEIKGTDSTSFPPCSSVCLEKLKRANLVACVYKRAVLEDPHVWKPESNGWNLSDGKYAINWFSGSQVPEAVCGQIDDESIAQDDDIEVTYSYEPDSDTDD